MIQPEKSDRLIGGNGDKLMGRHRKQASWSGLLPTTEESLKFLEGKNQIFDLLKEKFSERWDEPIAKRIASYWKAADAKTVGKIYNDLYTAEHGRQTIVKESSEKAAIQPFSLDKDNRIVYLPDDTTLSNYDALSHIYSLITILNVKVEHLVDSEVYPENKLINEFLSGYFFEYFDNRKISKVIVEPPKTALDPQRTWYYRGQTFARYNILNGTINSYKEGDNKIRPFINFENGLFSIDKSHPGLIKIIEGLFKSSKMINLFNLLKTLSILDADRIEKRIVAKSFLKPFDEVMDKFAKFKKIARPVQKSRRGPAKQQVIFDYQRLKPTKPWDLAGLTPALKEEVKSFFQQNWTTYDKLIKAYQQVDSFDSLWEYDFTALETVYNNQWEAKEKTRLAIASGISRLGTEGVPKLRGRELGLALSKFLVLPENEDYRRRFEILVLKKLGHPSVENVPIPVITSTKHFPKIEGGEADETKIISSKKEENDLNETLSRRGIFPKPDKISKSTKGTK